MAERCEFACRNNPPIDSLTVTPDDFREFERKRPFHICRVETTRTRTFDSTLSQEDFTRGHEEISRLQAPDNRT
jgi:hypothetical protein